MLNEVGVFVQDGKGRTAIDYSVNALDLVQHENIVKSIRRRYSHNPMMRAVEGIIAWATNKAEWLLAARGEQQENVEPESYSFSNRTNTLSGDKSPSRNLGDWIMGKADDLKQRLLSSVAERSNRLQAKRKASGTLASRTALAEQAWRNGQLARNPKSFPAKLDNRYRKLLKDQVIRAGESIDLDPADFLHWVAETWDTLGIHYFAKSKSYPADPHFGWLIKCLATYSKAYVERDSVDLSPAPVQAPVTVNRPPAGYKTWEEYAEFLRVDRDVAHRELKAMTAGKELPDDDDPVYARIKEMASRKIVIGKFDEDEEAKPARRKLRKHRK